MKADIDRGEAVSMMEPLLISSTPKHYGPLADLAVELSEKSMGLKRSLPPPIVSALSDLVRAMNCYYSNLIEGHDTHPVDIERALNEDYSADPEKRDLQLEARAHIPVQQWIDEGGLKDRALTAPGPPTKNRKTLNWTTFTPPATAYAAATVDYFYSAVHSSTGRTTFLTLSLAATEMMRLSFF